ncbi:RNA polymerase sigma factor [Reichenbachiella ulvae]|uniref:Sigma-70 family RNA polymerase sigma factor n=1 Tax=Reichenbachiella ulvae TaxID=2980104 RepID=A0ABT3CZR2_9BACT|nr:sigma-70 family RNA polymerase sigma factor [Reichenbachiella ulvae]MCV9389137.1 sigma-70 family RNA polymerase sigma factor [Reichenbachiella ulvae]
MSDPITDRELIEKIKKGDTASFTLLVNRHKNYALTIATRITLVREEAEEVAHDAFIKAYSSLHQFKQDAKFTTWFYRIVVNMAISRVRKKKLSTIDIDQSNYAGADNSSQEKFDARDRSQLIQDAMRQLSEDDRMLISLYYLEELDMEELSEISGFDKNNLKVKLFRARKRLGQILQKSRELESVIH